MGCARVSIEQCLLSPPLCTTLAAIEDEERKDEERKEDEEGKEDEDEDETEAEDEDEDEDEAEDEAEAEEYGEDFPCCWRMREIM